MDKIKVVILEPNEVPRVETIDNTLETLQAIVGGYIECIPTNVHDILVNEDGKSLDLEPNFALYGGRDYVAGTAIFIKTDYQTGDFVSLPEEQIKFITGIFKGREKYYRDN
jgi:hypothetical protein